MLATWDCIYTYGHLRVKLGPSDKEHLKTRFPHLLTFHFLCWWERWGMANLKPPSLGSGPRLRTSVTYSRCCNNLRHREPLKDLPWQAGLSALGRTLASSVCSAAQSPWVANESIVFSHALQSTSPNEPEIILSLVPFEHLSQALVGK